MNKKELKLVLNQINLTPKRGLGQNFLIDQNIINKIILEADLHKEDIILEIGTGIGALTSEFISKVKKIYSYEIDPKLFNYVQEKFNDIEEIEIINEDILKADLPSHNKIVSNIPFTMTGPILEKLFYNAQRKLGILIIEKSIAERIFLSRKYKNFSRITITFNAFMEPLKILNISSHCFFPCPKIDLALIKVKTREKIHPMLLKRESKDFFLKFTAGIMPYKNKNILNSIQLFFTNSNYRDISKREILEFLNDYNFKNIKIFQYSIKEILNLCSQLFSWLKKNNFQGL